MDDGQTHQMEFSFEYVKYMCLVESISLHDYKHASKEGDVRGGWDGWYVWFSLMPKNRFKFSSFYIFMFIMDGIHNGYQQSLFESTKQTASFTEIFEYIFIWTIEMEKKAFWTRW